jgi:Ca2+-binding RTX toxin-like protein
MDITGTSGNDSLTGTEVDDFIRGLAGNDTLTGLGGNDTLDAGTGGDRLIGGTGNDIYIVDGPGDTVVENAGEGVDTVRSSASRTLDANVENLTLTGTAGIYGIGNSLNNVITGTVGIWVTLIIMGLLMLLLFVQLPFIFRIPLSLLVRWTR